MRVCVAVKLPDGTQVDRPPTESELQALAERYVVTLIQLSLPGSRVRLSRSKEKMVVAAFGT